MTSKTGNDEKDLLEEFFLTYGLGAQRAKLFAHGTRQAASVVKDKVRSRFGLNIGPRPKWMKDLGLSRSASRADASKAFRTLQKQYHPDRPENKDDTKFREVQAAWELAKAYYDKQDAADKKAKAAAEKKAHKKAKADQERARKRAARKG